MSSYITGAAHAVPHTSRQEDLWDRFFSAHYDDNAIARRLFRSVGVETRHAVVSPLSEDVSQWSTAQRMQRYIKEATPLVQSAVSKSLLRTSVDTADIGMFAVASCTGYVTPGIDTLVAQSLDISPQARHLMVGHMGCHAALPSLATIGEFVERHGAPAVLACAELSSLHVQPPTSDVEQMVAHALFSDAAASVVVEPVPSDGALEIVDTITHTEPAHMAKMTWDVTDLGFRMGLSEQVPDVLQQFVSPSIDRILARNGLHHSDVAGWAVHPGGPRVLDVVSDALELKPDALDHSRAVLRQHGNCSSATVLLVLEELRAVGSLHSGQYAVAMAFGPGLTLAATLLRAV